MARSTERALRAGRELTDPQIGIFRRVTVSSPAPDEPRVYTATVERSHPAAMTDGVPVPPGEGGCALTPEDAAAAAIGEGVERYCSVVYRDEALQKAADAELDRAIDPTDVRGFSATQQQSGDVPAPLYEDGDEISWVRGQRLSDGAVMWLPAQLVYLSYDSRDEPFVRAPISTGLAAGFDHDVAVEQGLLEVIERDAFVIHYLAKSPLPRIRIEHAAGAVGTLTDRLDRAGIKWHLLDARTDLGIPVVIAVLVDPASTPAVSVAAAARASPADAVQTALEEAIQTRLYQRYLLDTVADPGPLDELNPGEIRRETRLLAWSQSGAADHLGFWLDSQRTITLAQLAAASTVDDVQARAAKQWALYTADVTTPDVAQTGFTVVRVVAPAAQPLYLSERHRYWELDRLQTVPVACGHLDEPPTQADLNDYPHPFP